MISTTITRFRRTNSYKRETLTIGNSPEGEAEYSSSDRSKLRGRCVSVAPVVPSVRSLVRSRRRGPGRLRWPLGFSVIGSDSRTVGAWTRLPRDCGSPVDRSDAVSMRPSWPGWWPWNGSRVASWRSLCWIAKSRRPGRSVGRCMDLSLGVGRSRPPRSRGSRS
jgi:hypothetical protein